MSSTWLNWNQLRGMYVSGWVCEGTSWKDKLRPGEEPSWVWTAPSGGSPDIKRSEEKAVHLCLHAFTSCWQVHLLCTCHYPLLASEPRFFSFPTRIDWLLPRNCPGLQCQTGTSEASSPVGWITTGFSASLAYRQPPLDYPDCTV